MYELELTAHDQQRGFYYDSAIYTLPFLLVTSALEHALEK